MGASNNDTERWRMGVLSELSRLSDGEEAKSLERTVEVLGPKTVGTKKIPSFEMRVSYISWEELAKLGTQKGGSRKKRDDGKLDLEAEAAFRSRLLRKSVKGWTGLTKENLKRLSSFALQHPQAVDKLDYDENGEIAYSTAQLEGLVPYIEFDHFQTIHAAITEMADFTDELLAEEKND